MIKFKATFTKSNIYYCKIEKLEVVKETKVMYEIKTENVGNYKEKKENINFYEEYKYFDEKEEALDWILEKIKFQLEETEKVYRRFYRMKD